MILKKKIIASLGVLLLPMIPILTIATRSMGTTTETSVVSSNTIPKVGHWQKAAGSKLTNGERGKFFQARNGDLYVMGKGTGLEVLKKGEATFKLAPGSITTNGEFGTIFQARNGDLYVMGKGTGLEVLKYGEKEFWEIGRGPISDGREATIFQTRNGDIYAIEDTRHLPEVPDNMLEVLRNGASSFTLAPGAAINNGYEFHFFEARNGDLYVAGTSGFGKQLYFLKNGASRFVAAPGSTVTSSFGMRFLEAKNGDLYVLHEKGLDVLKQGQATFESLLGVTTNGAFGQIFQTRNGDIYVLGHNTRLKVLKNGASSFTIAHGSRINNGRDGRIFEAGNGDLYVMGKGTGLEVLKKGTSTFASAPGSKIQNGSYGQFFQARNGDLYVMSQYSTLEVLKSGAESFQRARGSKITTGLFAKIFQARNGDIYTMGYNAPLQVLKKGEDKFKAALGSKIKNGRLGRFFQARNGDLYAMADSGLEVLKGEQLEFSLTHETSLGQNDGQIKLTNYKNQFSKLQYRKEGTSAWDDVPLNGIINSLSPGLYEFQWVAKDGFQYDESTTNIGVVNEKQLIASAEVIDIPTPPTFTLTKETTIDANDGSITVTNFDNSHSQLQYRKTLTKDAWKNVPSSGQITNLSPGEYLFRWKSRNYQYYRGIASIVVVIEKKQMVVSASSTSIPLSPTFYKTDETIKGLNDGKIIVRNLLHKYPRFQLWYATNWYDYEHEIWESGFSGKDIPADGIIDGLETNGKYYAFPKFAVLRYGYERSIKLFTDKEVDDILKFRRIDTEYDENQNPTKYKVILKSYFEENDHWLQYKKTSSSKWKNVLSSGIIDNLSPGVYQFRWKSKKMQTYEDTLQPTRLIEESFTILEGTNILVPLLPNFQVAPETTSGGNDGIITITNFTNANSKLQYRKEGTPTWTDVPSNGIIGGLIPGGYEFQWTSKDSDLYDETSGNTYALKKQIVLSYARKTALETAKGGFNNFKQALDNSPNHPPNGNVNESTLINLAGHNAMPAPVTGITRSFKIYTNQKTGVANVIVSFTSGSGSNQILGQASYIIEGFKSQAQIDAEILKNAIQGLNANDLDARSNSSINTFEITRSIVLEWIMNINTISILTSDQKELLKINDINININRNELGTLNVTINGHGNPKKIIISGFSKNWSHLVDELGKKLSNLSNDALKNKGDPSKRPDEITKWTVFNWLSDDDIYNESQKLSINEKKLMPFIINVKFYRIKNDQDQGALFLTIRSPILTPSSKSFDRITGFRKSKEFEDKEAVTNMIRTFEVAGVNTLIDATILPDAITVASVFEEIKKLKAFIELTNDQKSLFKDTYIKLYPNNSLGELVIQIADPFLGVTSFNLRGFQTIDGKAVNDFISSLDDSNLASHINDQTLPSAITSQNVLEAIQKTPIYDALTATQKILIKVDDISLADDDTNGTLTITIANHGENKVISLSGFENQKQVDDETAVQNMVHGLRNIDLNALIDASILPDAIIATSVFEEIKKVQAFTELTNDQKALFKVSNISLANDNMSGTLTITIANHGENKVISLSGFKNQKQVEDETAIKNMIQSLRNADLVALVDKNILPDKIIVTSVFEEIKKVQAFTELTSDQQALLKTDHINLNPSNSAGELTITINSYGEKISILLIGFKTTAKKLAEGAIARDKTNLSNFGNQNVIDMPNPLAGGFTDKTTLETFAGHRAIPKPIAGVTRAYRISTDLATGIATVIIDLTSGESPNQVFDTFTYTINGFKTQAQINANLLKIAVQALNASDLNGNGDSLKLPSEMEKTTVLSWIKALSSINGLADDVKNLLVENDIMLAFNDEEGILTVTINNHGTSKTFDEISGFRIQTNSEALLLAVQALDVNGLSDKGDSSKLPSEVKKATVLGWIKALSSIKNLAIGAKDLLLEDNIILRNSDEEGSLVITINSHDDPKTFSKILGFKTNAKKAIEDAVNTDKDLFNDFDQTLTRRIEPLEDGVVADLTPLTSNGHQALPPQTSGVTREFKIARAATGTATMTVTFKAGTSLNQVSETITYKISGFKVITFQDFSSSTTYSSLSKKLKIVTSEPLAKDVKAEFEKINDYATYNNVDSTVILSKVEVVASDEIQRQVTYKITFNIDGSEQKEKDIIVTFALDLDADAKKFKDFISSAKYSELQSNAIATSGETPPNVQADFIKIPGYAKPPNLSADVTIKSVIVKTPYNASTRQVVYTLTITNGKEDKSFDLTVTFKPDFALERAKFKNFDSNFGTYIEIAIAPKNGNDVKALFEKIDGYVIPKNLATGVKIYQVVVKEELNTITRQVIYNIKLWDGKNIDTSEHGIIVTFANDLDAGAHQLVNFSSSDNVQSAAALLPQNESNVKATFEAITNYDKPTLAKNVKITKVIVKKALDASTRKVTFTITLAKTNQNDGATLATQTKDVIVTFAPNLDEEAKKFSDFTSSDNVKSKAALLKQNNDDIKTTFEAISGFTKPVLTSGVQMSKAIVKKALSDSRVIFTITLAYEGIRKTKDVTVTFKKVSISKSESLSTGAIVGIVIGSIAGLGILGYLIYYLMKRK